MEPAPAPQPTVEVAGQAIKLEPEEKLEIKVVPVEAESPKKKAPVAEEPAAPVKPETPPLTIESKVVEEEKEPEPAVEPVPAPVKPKPLIKKLHPDDKKEIKDEVKKAIDAAYEPPAADPAPEPLNVTADANATAEVAEPEVQEEHVEVTELKKQLDASKAAHEKRKAAIKDEMVARSKKLIDAKMALEDQIEMHEKEAALRVAESEETARREEKEIVDQELKDASDVHDQALKLEAMKTGEAKEQIEEVKVNQDRLEKQAKTKKAATKADLEAQKEKLKAKNITIDEEPAKNNTKKPKKQAPSVDLPEKIEGLSDYEPMDKLDGEILGMDGTYPKTEH